MQGHAVDELFSDKRTDRLQYNSQLAERSPGVTGKEPLKKFVRKNTEWFDYWPGPTAQYYSEELIFSSCHYRNRYAYDYSIQFDIDEFWTPANSTVEQLLPDFLDKHMEEQTAEILFTQVCSHSTTLFQSRMLALTLFWSTCSLHTHRGMPPHEAHALREIPGYVP